MSAIGNRAGEAGASHETGRRAILAGWVMTLLGIFGYIAAFRLAGEQSDLVDVLAAGGAAAWGSLLLLLGGVAVWVFGNVVILQDLAKHPGADE